MMTSCTDDTLKNVDNSESMSDELLAEREILKETSFLVGKLLNNPDVRNEVITKMKIVDERDFNISLHALMGHESFMTYKEQQVSSQFLAKNNQNHFKEAFVNELSKNEIEYPSLAKMRKSQLEAGILKSGNDFELGVNAKIYIPFLEVNEDEDDLGDDFYISYDPLNFDNPEGYIIDEDGIIKQTIEVDFDFANDNPVVAIVPIDPCEYDPDNCGDQELLPLEFDPVNNFYLSDDPGFEVPTFTYHYDDFQPGGIYSGSNSSGSATQNSGNPNAGNEWPGSGNTQRDWYLLATNENSANFHDGEFLVYTEFTAFRSRSSTWMRAYDSYLRHRFKVARGKVAIQNTNGSVVPASDSEELGGGSIRRHRAARLHRWYDLKKVVDYDWSLRKDEQVFSVWTRHNFLSNTTVNFQAKFGAEVSGDTVQPTASALITIDVPITGSSEKYRAQRAVPRSFAFGNNVGWGPTTECLNYEGHCFFIYNMHHTDFILRHYVSPHLED